MHRFTMLLALLAVMLLGAALGTHSQVWAQEVTPAAGAEEGLTFEPVTFALGVDLPQVSDIFVARIGLDPSSGILLVESGTFTIQVEGPVTVTRGDTLMESMMEAEAVGDVSAAAEAIPAGGEVTVSAGDAAYIPGGVNGEIRNDGPERAAGLAFLVSPSGLMTEATPEP
jgi:hypothetical protein